MSETITSIDNLTQSIGIQNVLMLVVVGGGALIIVLVVLFLTKVLPPALGLIREMQATIAKERDQFASLINTTMTESVKALGQINASVNAVPDFIVKEHDRTRKHVSDEGHLTTADVIKAFSPITETLGDIRTDIRTLVQVIPSQAGLGQQVRELADKFTRFEQLLANIERQTLRQTTEVVAVKVQAAEMPLPVPAADKIADKIEDMP